MTTKRPGVKAAQARKLKLKKESLKDLDARRKAGRVKGGGASLGFGVICQSQGCATALYTNCNVSCIAVCGGGGFKIG
jgi:hypothetical protein